VRTCEASGTPRRRVLPALEGMQDHAIEAATFLKALANDQRLLMLCCLIDGALSVGEINARVPLSQSALSQHLGVLREAGLVTTTRKSQTVITPWRRVPRSISWKSFTRRFAGHVPRRNALKGRRARPRGRIAVKTPSTHSP